MALRGGVGVEAAVGGEVLATTCAYPDRQVELHFLRCEVGGTPAPQLGQEMRWVAREELALLAFPPADAELIQILVGARPTRSSSTPNPAR